MSVDAPKMRLAFCMTILLVAAPLPAGAEKFERIPPVNNAAARKECGACHIAYPPLLMPAESWRAVFADLPHHFGDDAGLPEALRENILAYYIANAGPAAGGPVMPRITEQSWWQSVHRKARDFCVRAGEVPEQLRRLPRHRPGPLAAPAGRLTPHWHRTIKLRHGPRVGATRVGAGI